MRGHRYVFLLIISLTVLNALAHGAAAAEPTKRHFFFSYKVRLGDVPAGALRLWIPVAPNNGEQTVRLAKVSSPVPLTPEKEDEYGNSLLFGSVKAPAKEVEIELLYDVTRRETQGDLTGSGTTGSVPREELARFLMPDRLVPLNERIRKLAAEVTAGRATPLAKARAIYDYTVDNLSYDKSGTGWGRGDIDYVCDLKRGNCTDFHSLFIGLCRASGIPARFIIGFPLPEGTREGRIGGYHCWAEFYLEGKGWVPADASEASKDKTRKEYYFGNLCENRVEFTRGRDILLKPPQQEDRLNYFIYPYAELDGKPYDKMEWSFSFREI
ncbi:transglutaminase-like domain-containing protein [Geobacter sp. AOG1]|uniref:transglutaminase-like domain-containing protein n=1 Tax=Geobacter sp. AOG1 TaxID=1566346 RepID=UPI001CC67ECB|nr:transglutaminase domain-containing protein [Geobacter sp. AOG1]GFE56266.1 hypothetical protein AOG1_01440 [Geobacter sp. AOG1]